MCSRPRWAVGVLHGRTTGKSRLVDCAMWLKQTKQNRRMYCCSFGWTMAQQYNEGGWCRGRAGLWRWVKAVASAITVLAVCTLRVIWYFRVRGWGFVCGADCWSWSSIERCTRPVTVSGALLYQIEPYTKWSCLFSCCYKCRYGNRHGD